MTWPAPDCDLAHGTAESEIGHLHDAFWDPCAASICSGLLDRLVDSGKSVIVIEHHLA